MKNFYFIIITDLLSYQKIFSILTKVGKILEKDGKLLITSINPKWNKILRFLGNYKNQKEN